MKRNSPNPTVRKWRRMAWCVALAAAFFLAPRQTGAFDLVLGTDRAGSFAHFAGRSLCRLMNRTAAAGLTCNPVATSGDVYNLTNLQAGAMDMAVVDARMLYDAVHRKGAFEYLDIDFRGIRLVAPLFDNPVTLVVRQSAGITAPDQLKGKRLNTGVSSSIQQRAWEALRRTKGWQQEDFRAVYRLSSSQGQDTMALCHGTVEAMFHIGVHPDSGLQQMLELCDAGLMGLMDGDIEKMVAERPYYSLVTVPGATYPKQPEAIATFGTAVVLVASADLDDETVYAVSEAIQKGRERLADAHPALSAVTLEAIGLDERLGVRTHPGAVAFQRAAGLQ